jgi:hypothetical protein
MSTCNLPQPMYIETGKFGKKCSNRGKYKNCAKSSAKKAKNLKWLL